MLTIMNKSERHIEHYPSNNRGGYYTLLTRTVRTTINKEFTTSQSKIKLLHFFIQQLEDYVTNTLPSFASYTTVDNFVNDVVRNYLIENYDVVKTPDNFYDNDYWQIRTVQERQIDYIFEKLSFEEVLDLFLPPIVEEFSKRNLHLDEYSHNFIRGKYRLAKYNYNLIRKGNLLHIIYTYLIEVE